jgi:hypothetical protein
MDKFLAENGIQKMAGRLDGLMEVMITDGRTEPLAYNDFIYRGVSSFA